MNETFLRLGSERLRTADFAQEINDTVYPKTSLRVIIPLACSIPAAMMLNQGFSIHHEAHKGHEELTIGLEKRPDFNMIYFSFVVVYFG